MNKLVLFFISILLFTSNMLYSQSIWKGEQVKLNDNLVWSGDKVKLKVIIEEAKL